MKKKRRFPIVLMILFVVIILIIATYLVLLAIDPNPSRPDHIDDPTGFVKASGTNLYDGEGKFFQMKGVNLGNWFDQEYWMAVSAVGDFDTGVYTQLRGDAAMRVNPNLTDEQIEELNDIYLDNYIQESDFETIALLGMNTVRIPFTYYNLTTDGKTFREDAFARLDWAVSMCEKYELYAIIDLHGAVGSQNQDIHSGDDSQFHLYDSKENRQMTKDLWAAIAGHFKGNQTVAAYDLLNETRRAPHKYTGKINFDFYDELYRVVREADPDHLILIECFSFPVNGVHLSSYDWENICMEYHIYNLTPLSQLACLRFYKALHNLMGYHTPVYIGEWNAFAKESEWRDSFAWFDKQGWSFTSWTYKTNARYYRDFRFKLNCNWGLYELDMEAVDLSSAGFEEIASVYTSVKTENARQTVVYDLWEEYLSK